MSIFTTRTQRRVARRDNARQPPLLAEVPRELWPWAPHTEEHQKRSRIWRSRAYLVQEFQERDGIMRLSVNRAELDGDRWQDGLTWDDLQEVKRQVGYADSYAVEVFPRERDLVNVANMRHLWVLPTPLSIGWFSSRPTKP